MRTSGLPWPVRSVVAGAAVIATSVATHVAYVTAVALVDRAASPS